MDIVKLYTNPNGTLKAAHITDGAESYPVLIEALGSTTLLPELIKSGWQLQDLPLKLVKNGMPMESLPKAEWTPAMEQQYGQDMYDMLGTPMTVEERRKFLYHGATVTAFSSMDSYRYNTREEFIQYLKSIKSGVADEDYLPLNCIVAPSARFTIAEFCDKECQEYRTLIAFRRNFNFARYTQLVKFLQKHGMPETFNNQDFLKAYHQWGVDGVQFATVGEPTLAKVHIVEGGYGGNGEVASVGLLPAMKQVYVLVKKPVGGGLDVLCPPGIKPNDLYSSDQIKPYNSFNDAEEQRLHRFDMNAFERQQMNRLQPGQAMAMRRQVRSPSFRLEMHVSGSSICDTIHITYKSIKFGSVITTAGFSFRNSANEVMPVDYIGNPFETRRAAYLMAIAKDIVRRRKKQSNRSAYSALQECGFSMLPALNYMASTTGYGIPRENPQADDDGNISPVMSRDTLVEYVRAKANPDQEQDILDSLTLEETFGVEMEVARASVIEMLDSFIDGSAGDADLGEAIAYEDSITADKYYESFRAIIDCSGLTADQLFDQVKQWVPGNPIMLELPDGTKVKLDGEVETEVETAYEKLKKSVRLNQVTDSVYYVWVDGAIKALGDPDFNKHSGVFCTVLSMKSNKCQDVRREFSYYYVKRVMEELEPLKAQNYMRWNELMHCYLGVPSVVGKIDYGQIPMVRMNTGMAQIVAATMMMQMLMRGIARIPLPTGAKIISAADAPDLAKSIDSIRKYVVNTNGSFFCDCQSFCDYVTSAEPGQLQYWLYPVNAIITPDKVLPRPGFKITEYDGVFSYNYSTFLNIYTEAGTTEKLPPVAHRQFYTTNEIGRRSIENDLIYALISGQVTGYKSYMQQYYREALSVANAWRDSSTTEHLDAVSGPWEAAWSVSGVHGISSGRAEPLKEGLPCFRPSNAQKMLEPEKHVVEEVPDAIKPYDGILADEYRNGVQEITSLPRRGRAGFLLVDGDFISVCPLDTSLPTRVINPADIATLNPMDYPVEHIYGGRWLFRDVHGSMFYVEV